MSEQFRRVTNWMGKKTAVNRISLLLTVLLAATAMCAQPGPPHGILGPKTVDVVFWGDSLTYGGQGYIDAGIYPTDVQRLIAVSIKNMGFPGATSTEIGVLEGALPTSVTVTGAMIPSTAGVVVTFLAGHTPALLDDRTDSGITGTILGVHGSLTFSCCPEVLTFIPTTPGAQVSAPGTPEFVIDTPYADYLPVFWEGRNNASDPAQILSDLAAQVQTVPSGTPYLILPVTNLNAKSEWIGGAGYKLIIGLNNDLAKTYTSNYLDIRKMLVESYDPALITDVSDYTHDEIPTSLRAINLTTTLAGPIGPTETTFTVTTPAHPLTANDILTIDTGVNAENVEIAAVDGDKVTVVRNFGGLDTSHPAGAPVTETDYIHLNAQGYKIVANAVANWLSKRM